jgi:c-di-GMP-binding flagellar brake protein YcgR
MQDFEEKVGLDLAGLNEELLEDLGRQSLDEIQKLRADSRVELKIAITLRPGNSSERRDWESEGHTKDISRGGCRAVLADPPCVGDIFRLSFQDTELGLPMVFARCLRVRLVREDVFDCGFRFFSSLEIPEASERRGSDLFD